MPCTRLKHDITLERLISELTENEFGGDRQPFALPDTQAQYAPDRQVDVTHIALDVSFEIERRVMNGNCTVHFSAIKDNLRRLTLDAAEMEILEVQGAGGKSLDFEHTGMKLHISLAKSLKKEEHSSVQVRYRVSDPRLGLYFVQPDDHYPDKPVQIWTQGQDEDSKYWYPCFDYPNEKATSEVIATVPENFYVLSNGELVETTRDEKSGEKTYHWKQDIPHVSYLITLVAGEFVEHTDTYEDIPVSYLVPPGREEDGERSFGKTPDMVQFFSEKLNFKYPYKKYAQIAVEDFVFGGMENTSATTQTALTLHDARAHLDYESEPLVAHELAHQWFGDLLTCKDWSHAWLNEGFATYFEALYREYDLGEDEFQYEMYGNAKRYFAEDAKYRRPIVTNQYREPIDIFDRHLYEKGSLVLHMLRNELGDETFWAVMNHYLNKHAQQNVETIDLIRAVEDITGRNMKKFFDQWVFGAGFPVLTVTYSWEPDEEEDSGSAKIVVKQTQKAGEATSLFTFPVEIQFITESQTHTEKVTISEKEHVFYFPLDVKPAQFLFDPENWILKQLTLEVPQELLLEQVQNSPYCMARIQAAYALKKSPSAKVVDTLGAVLRNDCFWGVQSEIASVLGDVQTTRALSLLVESVSVGHPKARRAVAEALGSYHNPDAVEALSPLASRDKSYFVESAANAALGKTRSDGVFDIIKKSLSKDSYNEVIRAGVFSGFAELDNKEAIPVLEDYLEPGKPPMARAAAAAALGKLGQDNKSIVKRLLDLLTPEEHFRVKIGTITGLQHINDSAAVPRLKSYAEQEPNGMLKRMANMAARTIQSQQKQSKAVKTLQDEVDAMHSERMKLIERLEKLESKMNGES